MQKTVRYMLAALLLTALTVTACGGKTAPPRQYDVVVTVGSGGYNTEHIVISLSTPQTNQTPPSNECMGTASDSRIGLTIDITNTSASTMVVGLMISGATEHTTDYGYYVWDQVASSCDALIGAMGPTYHDPSGNTPATRLIASPQPVKPGGSFRFTGFIGVTGGISQPDLRKAFLRVDSVQSSLPYTITSLRSRGSNAGLVTGGHYEGGYFIPLGSGSPCSGFAQGEPMRCAATLP